MKHIAITSIFVMVPFAAMADQSVYIDQAGENLTMTITQKAGDGNEVGDVSGASQYFTISGDSQTYTINQEGDLNKLRGTISGDNLTYTLNQVGDGNEFDWLATLSSYSTLTFNITGSYNMIDLQMGQETSAEYTTFTYNIDGTDNTFIMGVDADGVTHTVDVTGDANAFDITQTGYGSSLDGHTIKMTMVGNDNTVTIDQSTTLAASNINMVTDGSNQTITISQSD
jgi:hypothetical protein